MKDLLSSCSAWTRFGNRIGSIGWLGVKPVLLLPYAKSSQRLGRSLKVLSCGLLPILPSIRKDACLFMSLCLPTWSQLLSCSVNLARASGWREWRFISFPSALWGPEQQMARQSAQLIYREIVFSCGWFSLLAVRKGSTIICLCQRF